MSKPKSDTNLGCNNNPSQRGDHRLDSALLTHSHTHTHACTRAHVLIQGAIYLASATVVLHTCKCLRTMGPMGPRTTKMFVRALASPQSGPAAVKHVKRTFFSSPGSCPRQKLGRPR